MSTAFKQPLSVLVSGVVKPIKPRDNYLYKMLVNSTGKYLPQLTVINTDTANTLLPLI